MSASRLRILGLMISSSWLFVGCSPAKKIDVGGACILNSDCNQGLVCSWGECHAACHTTADCQPGQSCIIASPQSTACESPTPCIYNSNCPTGLICAVDQQCRKQCQSNVDCTSGQTCTSTQTCAEPSQVDSSNSLIVPDGGAGDASGAGGIAGGGKAGVPEAPGTQPDARIGGAGGGAGGIGGGDGGISACVTPPSGLVGWWPGNGNANDIVGGDNGTFTGTYAVGKVGQAFRITSSAYVEIPSSAAVNPAAVSVEAWFLRNTTSGISDPIVNGPPGFSLEFGWGSASAQVFLYVHTGGASTGLGGPGDQSSPGGTVANGVWVHAVGVYNGSQLGLYINGAFVGSSSATGPMLVPTAPVGIGHTLADRSFDGLIDEVSIYDRALSATEVQALYASGSAGKCASSLPDASGSTVDGDAGVTDALLSRPDTPAAGTTGTDGGASIVGYGISGQSCKGMTGTECNGESCCTSLPVPAGTFPMGRGTEACSNCTNGCPGGMTCYSRETPEHSVTVSAFSLDKYEVTVGRFRRFVDAYDAMNAPPPMNAGANPNTPGTGWQAVWNGNMPADSAAFRSNLKCDSTHQTWTDLAGNNEAYPINCVNWYEAFAFCLWDGGRLPTEAEWEYAAAGGDQNHLYPWGSSLPSCSLANGPGCVGNLATVGSYVSGQGRWGHMDLAGNVWESVFDWYSETWYSSPSASVTDPADTTSSPNRVQRGGSFDDSDVGYLRTVFRTYATPTGRYFYSGLRCTMNAAP
jgi:formylglycine-generating enzyme